MRVCERELLVSVSCECVSSCRCCVLGEHRKGKGKGKREGRLVNLASRSLVTLASLSPPLRP